jgi:hypothetical protein
VDLVPESDNPVDPYAIAVFSARGIQIGYLTAERAPWVGSMMRNGKEMISIFQQATATGAVIRIGIDGEQPILPEAPPKTVPRAPDDDFWPDYIPPDD